MIVNNRRSFLLVMVAVALALAVRLPLLFAPLQVDEFNTLFEIAARRSAAEDRLPGANDPLLLVESADEVRERAVLPYGVRHPFPLFPLALCAFLAPLPLAEWSLRLPSLIAGLATVIALAALAQRLAGPAAAVTAAFLAALDPMLVVTSVTARPYAVAGLAIAVSFILHPALLAPGGGLALCASPVGYGLALALTAYLNPVLMIVVVAHFFVAVLPFARRETGHRAPDLRLPMAWAAGVGIVFLLTLPLTAYLRQIGEVRRIWGSYLSSPSDLLGFELRPLFFLEHNLAVLLLLFACALTWTASRLRRPSPAEERSVTAIPAAPMSQPWAGPRAAMLCGACWLLLPQLAALILHFSSSGGHLQDRYLFYTSQGGILLTAGIIAARGSASARREMALLCAVTLFMFLGFRGVLGHNLMTDRFPVVAAQALTALDARGLWESENVLLFHSALLEADLPPEAVPEPNRSLLRQAFLAPLSSIYVGANPRRAIGLPRSIPCRGRADSWIVREEARPERVYDERLAAKLREYPRYWFLDLAGDRPLYLSCFLPWLADALDSPLTVTLRKLESPERVVRTLTVSPDDDPLDELPIAKGGHNLPLALVERAH
jgi:hypothetical protein